MATLTAAWVRVGGARYALSEQAPFTFGRSRDCTVVLDPRDIAISRTAGAVESDAGGWWLANRSDRRDLVVVDELGFRNMLPPQGRILLDAPVAVGVVGMHATHELVVIVPHGAGRPPEQEPMPATRTSIANGVLINEADRLAMVALFAGYLEAPPRYEPSPRTYADAAARLGWSKTTLIQRVEYLCSRLTKAGVPDLVGWSALPALADYAIGNDLIVPADLALLAR
ncbi:MAG: hypothetical protein WCB04_08550 [Mycobacteriales bacterium]